MRQMVAEYCPCLIGPSERSDEGEVHKCQLFQIEQNLILFILQKNLSNFMKLRIKS